MPRPPPKGDKDKSRAKAHAIASNSSENSSLFTIPLEVRRLIYVQVLQDDRDDACASLTELALVNHQLSEEVRPFFYKLPMTFEGQAELFEWLEEVDHDFLFYVSDVSFKLLDIDPEKIVGALGKRLREAHITRDSNSRGPNTQENPYYEACNIELRRIQRAFRLFPNLKHFTILTAGREDPQPPRTMVSNFSKMVGTCFPNLLSLESYENMMPGDFISDKPKLKRLRFSATTTSDAEELKDILEDLPNLNLELCRFHRKSRQDDAEGLAAETLHLAKPLRSLTLFESDNLKYPDLMNEICSKPVNVFLKHQNSLRSLKLLAPLSGDQEERERVIRMVSEFLRKSRVNSLDMISDYRVCYTHLPKSTEIVTLRLDIATTESIKDMLRSWLGVIVHVAKCNAKSSPHALLDEIKICVNGNHYGATDEALIGNAQSICEKIGYHLDWTVLDPDDVDL